MCNERKILVFTCLAHAFTHVYMLIFPSVLEAMQKTFELEVDQLTWYATISTVLFGAGALPAGWLGDRLGEKILLVAFFFLTALGGVLLGVASNVFLLAVGMAVMGLGTSIFHPVGNALISKGLRHPGRAMGVNGLWGSLGTAGGPFYAGLVLAATDSWRLTYLVLGAPMLALGIWLASSRIEILPESEQEPGRHRAEGPTRQPRTRTIVMLAFLLAAMTCGGLYFHLITTMLPRHLEDRTSLPDSFAGASGLLPHLLTAFVYLVGGAGQILAGRLVQVREGRGLYILMLSLAAPLVFLTSILQGVPLVSTAALMAIFLFAVQPIENTLLARNSPASHRGVLFGMKFVLAFGVGGLGTGIAGQVEEHWGRPAVFVAASAMTAVALLFGLAAWSCFRRDDQRE